MSKGNNYRSKECDIGFPSQIDHGKPSDNDNMIVNDLIRLNIKAAFVGIFVVAYE
jgi:hypothetical protein